MATGDGFFADQVRCDMRLLWIRRVWRNLFADAVLWRNGRRSSRWCRELGMDGVAGRRVDVGGRRNERLSRRRSMGAGDWNFDRVRNDARILAGAGADAGSAGEPEHFAKHESREFLRSNPDTGQ